MAICYLIDTSERIFHQFSDLFSSIEHRNDSGYIEVVAADTLVNEDSTILLHRMDIN